MKTTCCLNAVLCPNCGEEFDCNIGFTSHEFFLKECPKCKISLKIEYERSHWFTAEKID